MDSILTIRGNKIVKDGQPIRLRGTNFGNWMLIEHYMIGLPWTEHKMREGFREILGQQAHDRFFNTYMDCYITEEDVRFLAEDIGINCVRLPFTYRHFEDDRAPGEFRSAGFTYFDRVIEWFRKYDMYVMLDLHAAAGAQARDWNAESNYGEALLWEHPHFVRRTADLWRFIATRYANEPRVMGYALLCEPLCPSLDVLHQFNMECIKAIREVDTRHIILVQPNEWGKKIHSLQLEVFEDPLVMPIINHYLHQFKPFDKMSKEYPCEYEGTYLGRDQVRDTLKLAYDPSYIDRPYFCGEFNAHANLNLMDDMISVLEEYDIHWTNWSYKLLFPAGCVYPRATTPWRQFLAGESVKVLTEGYNKCMDDFIEALNNTIPQGTTLGMVMNPAEAQDYGLFKYQTRHHWHAMILPRILRVLKENHLADLEAMAKSFSLENCEIYQGPCAIMRKYCK